MKFGKRLLALLLVLALSCNFMSVIAIAEGIDNLSIAIEPEETPSETGEDVLPEESEEDTANDETATSENSEGENDGIDQDETAPEDFGFEEGAADKEPEKEDPEVETVDADDGEIEPTEEPEVDEDDFDEPVSTEVLGYAELNIEHTLTGENLPEEAVFTFKVEATDEVASPIETLYVTLTGTGITTANIPLTAIGEYNVRVTMVDDGMEGVTYDSSVWDVYFQACDASGEFSVENWSYKFFGEEKSKTQASFTSEYVSNDTVELAFLYYDANGGSGAPSEQSGSGDVVVFTVSDVEPSYDNSAVYFKGWATDPKTEDAQYHGGDEITVNKGETVTLYAVYAIKWNKGFAVRYTGPAANVDTITEVSKDLVLDYIISSPSGQILCEGTFTNGTVSGTEADVQIDFGRLELETPACGTSNIVLIPRNYLMDGFYVIEPITYSGTELSVEFAGQESDNAIALLSVCEGGSVTYMDGDEEVWKDNNLNPDETSIAPALVKENYHFQGWAVELGGNVVYQVGDEVEHGNRHLVLYAVWAMDITVDGESISVPEGTSLGDLAEPKKEGYAFIAWIVNDEKVDSEYLLQPGDVLVSTWALVIIVNGETVTVADGATIATLETPEREGYTFFGWSVNGVAVEDDYVLQPGDVVVSIWTLTIRVDGAIKTISDGTTLGDVSVPSRGGCVFAGWLVNGKTASKEYILRPGDELVSTWNLIIIVDGESKVVAEGSTIASLPVPTKSGRVFTGWRVNGNSVDNNYVLQPGDNVVSVWKLRITVDGESKNVAKGMTIADLGVPSKDGYSFEGWLVNGELADVDHVLQAGDVIEGSWMEVQKTIEPSPEPEESAEPSVSPSISAVEDSGGVPVPLPMMLLTVFFIAATLGAVVIRKRNS